MDIIYDKSRIRKDDKYLFTLMTPEREHAEWGLKTWIPAKFDADNIIDESINIISPKTYIQEINIPFVIYITENNTRKSIYLNCSSPDGKDFNIKHGVGSLNFDVYNFHGDVDFNIGNKISTIQLLLNTNNEITLQGTINTNIEIEANSIVRITQELTISSDASLIINEGVIVVIDEGTNISNKGPITFKGTLENPILVTCSEKNKYWDGFISNENKATINASYTFFCYSGYHDSKEYDWGHAMRQALFYTNSSSLTLDHCYILDHIGQVFYPTSSNLSISNSLIQRVKTGGQINNSTITIDNSIFTDFPDDSQIYADNDNDGIYINASNATISNSIFMYAKDDGMDSGLNEGGEIFVTNSIFEACFHEGAALSSKNEVNKLHSFRNCIFTNCGQGLELGFSSTNHNVLADYCEFYNNCIGIRYGDNYTWSLVNGRMTIKNSKSYNNDKDVWNMVRVLWSPKLDNIEFINTKVSSFVEQYPDLEVIEN